MRDEREEPAPELLPCPFCGKEPERNHSDAVGCGTPNCPSRGWSVLEVWNRRDSKSRSPAPADVDRDVERVLEEVFSAGERAAHAASAVEHHHIAADAITKALQALAGRSPAEVPPNWKADERVQELRERSAVRVTSTERAAIESPTSGTIIRHQFSPRSLDALLDAVWRSAQP